MASKRIDVVAGYVSPARTQSTGDSGTSPSSISSPSSEPCTPPANERTSRSRTRDGDRRPLHRRGKSKCLETLEDLLREAGYEQTRISTPEDEEMKGGEKSGMGAVVEFLSQFLPSSNSTSPETEQSTYYSRPTSPPQTSSSYATSEDTTPRQAAYNVHSRLQQLQQEHEMGMPPDRYLRDTHRSTESSDSQATVRPALAQPKPSRAGDYLRSMTSKASLMAPPPRPSSTPARSRAPFSMRGRRKTAVDDDDDPSIIFSQRGNGEAEDEVTHYHGRRQPPLPPSWLETVTKAVLFGGHVGGPAPEGSPLASAPSKTQPQSLRPSRSTLSQTSSSQHSSKQPTIRRGLTDQTNAPMPPPPFLFTMLEQGRAGRSESQVTRTRVVCRSAPGSRATSLTRRGSEKGRGRMQRRKKKGDHDDRLPSLARHHTEDDAWNNGRGVPSTANDVKNRYLSGVGMAPEPHGMPSSDDEEDHDGELDLARMLLHPKRQNSIRSLRKHLDAVESGSAYGSRRSKPPKKSPLHDDDDEWPHQQEDLGSGYVRRRGVADDEDDADTQAFAQFLGTLNNGGGPERPALPGWGTRR